MYILYIDICTRYKQYYLSEHHVSDHLYTYIDVKTVDSVLSSADDGQKWLAAGKVPFLHFQN